MTDPLSYLFGLGQFGIKFGLENMVAIVGRLGHPERAFRSLHIAGTNGKGSVTAMIDAGLRAAGHRSGRYTSPHLVDLTERFVIDGRPVAEDRMVAAVADVRAAIEQLLAEGVLKAHPTFFEVTTAVAFELFRRAGVDLAVLEVGLGGRLDATNVIEPVATAITSIAYDHQQYLGSTLIEIAREKAGIIKPRVPVVVGDVEPAVLGAIAEIARERGAPLIRAADGVTVTRRPAATIGLRTPVRDYGEVTMGLQGAHQIGNALVAVRMLELLDSQGIAVPAGAVRSALARPSWPGRLDLRRLPDGREILFDAAHNPAGAASLASYLKEIDTGRLPLVFAGMHDKDLEGMLRPLLPVVGPLVVTRASNRRSADPERLVELARRIAPETSVTMAASPLEALDIAWRASPRIIVAGSIFLLGDVMKLAQQGVIPFEKGS
ncbi:MAG TPA: folylpolyglutamate synthase/dihydrofolate synthase family protein [Vicinamibacterales bacterium]